MTAAVLILAATISTPRLGGIYTMPPWMPPSVSAANTPGSPRTAGSVPGAGRVTADTYAAYAAAQEAVLERAYYINARNGGLATHSPANVVYGWGVGDATKAATNLVFSPSIRILPRDGRKWLQTLLGYNRDLFSALNYDGWCFWTPSGSAISIGGYGVRLASTLMGAGRAFPDFEIGDKPMPGPWPDKGLTFGNCRGDFIMPNPWPDETGYFGEAGEAFVGDYIQYWSNYQAWTNAYAVTSAQSLTNLLAAAFDRQVDYRALTNDTERLLWHRLAAADQILAAVDRAYYSDYNWNQTFMQTNTTYTAYRLDECDVDASGTYLDASGNIAGRLSFGSWSTRTNRVTSTDSSGGSSAHIKVGFTSKFDGVGGMQIFEAPFYDATLTIADVAPHTDPVPEPSWTLPIEVWDAAMSVANGVITVNYLLHIVAGDTFVVTRQTPYAPQPVKIGIWSSAKSHYERTVLPTVSDLARFDIPAWPSQRAFADGKIKEFELASMGHIYDLAYTTNLWCCSGNMFNSLGSARTFAIRDISNNRAECLQLVSAKTRADPSRPNHIQRMVDRAVAYAETHELNAQPRIVHLGHYDEHHPPTIVWENGEIVRIDNPSLGAVGLHIDITPQTDPTIATVDCGMACETMQFYRADFQWDTLRKDD